MKCTPQGGIRMNDHTNQIIYWAFPQPLCSGLSPCHLHLLTYHFQCKRPYQYLDRQLVRESHPA